jgi:hypothetical protein|tara:strand:- start:322 stop:1062 length:741 start_codon:yes stop_codon:yes gene_type:complete
MKRLKTYSIGIGFLIFCMCFISCSKCAKKVGNVSEKKIQLNSFHSIRITGDFKIKLIQDSSYTLKISGGKGILENVVHEIVSDTLRIENQNKCNFLSNYNKNITLEIGVGSLQKIALINPGSLDNSGKLVSDNLLVEIRECGVKLNLNGEFKNLTLKAYTGTPTINLSGTCNVFSIDESSFGHIYAFDFISKNTNVNSRGTGFINVNVTDEFKVNQQGSGIIRFRGNPAIVEIKIKENSSAQVIQD